MSSGEQGVSEGHPCQWSRADAVAVAVAAAAAAGFLLSQHIKPFQLIFVKWMPGSAGHALPPAWYAH